MEHSELIYVKQVDGKGRGVFAKAPIKKGEIIEKVPILLVPIDHLLGGLHSPILSRFFFIWNKTHVAITLGYGSLYNHSYAPNAVYEHGRMTMIYRAVRSIAPEEEITINYNGDVKDKAAVGFAVV